MATPLKQVTQVLEALAPTRYAEPWDNVGLLVEPSRSQGISRALLTIDLSEGVLEEALAAKANLIIAYHPPIFRGLKRLGQATPTERIITRAIEEGIAVYSPHTALDAAPGGVNDWLCSLLGEGQSSPITQSTSNDPEQALKLVIFIPKEKTQELVEHLTLAGAGRIGNYAGCAFSGEGLGSFSPEAGAKPTIGEVGRREQVAENRLEMVCSRKNLPQVQRALLANHPYEEPAWDIYPLEPKPVQYSGMGRIHALHEPASLGDLISRIKGGIGLNKIRVAMHSAGSSREASSNEGAARLIERIAVCAGAGGSLFESVAHDPQRGPQLFLTGEMRHHDVLARVASGQQVILCDHTNTERGYLSVYAERIAERLPGLSLQLSTRDRDPLEII